MTDTLNTKNSDGEKSKDKHQLNSIIPTSCQEIAAKQGYTRDEKAFLEKEHKFNINPTINSIDHQSTIINNIENFKTSCTDKLNNINKSIAELEEKGMEIHQPEVNNYQPESQYISINAKAFSNNEFDDFQLNRISSDRNYKIFNSGNFENNFLTNFNSNMSPSHKQVSPRLIDSPLNGMDSSHHNPMGINFFTSSEVNNNSSNNVQVDQERKDEVFRSFRQYRDYFYRDIEKLKSTGRSDITITEIKELKDFILLIVNNYNQYDRLFERMAQSLGKAGKDDFTV